MAQDSKIQQFQDQFNQIQAMPSGTAFNINITDADASAALDEYLEVEADMVDSLIKDYLNVSVKITDPRITFSDGKISVVVKAGISFIKVDASITAAVTYENGQVIVKTESVKVPVITLEPATVDGYIQPLVNDMMGRVSQGADIQSVTIADGTLSIAAVKK